jgi:hypothetical protein
LINKSIEQVQQKLILSSFSHSVIDQIIEQLKIPAEHGASLIDTLKNNPNLNFSLMSVKQKRKTIKLHKKFSFLPNSLLNYNLDKKYSEKKRNVLMLFYLFKYLPGFSRFVKFNSIDDKSIMKVG